MDALRTPLESRYYVVFTCRMQKPIVKGVDRHADAAIRVLVHAKRLDCVRPPRRNEERIGRIDDELARTRGRGLTVTGIAQTGRCRAAGGMQHSARRGEARSKVLTVK